MQDIETEIRESVGETAGAWKDKDIKKNASDRRRETEAEWDCCVTAALSRRKGDKAAADQKSYYTSLRASTTALTEDY